MSARRRSILRLLLPVLVIIGLGALATPHASAATPSQVHAFLSGLVVAPEGSMTGYSRSQFPHWIDNNGDCQDTRDEVLSWESTVTPGWDAARCNVVSGRWWSAYDNRTFTNSSDVSIDHVIALAEAWRSGARNWSLTSRRSFANDLSHEESLRAVSISSNSSKGDRDPSEWLPTNTSFRCHYLKEWVVVKDTWNLTVDTAEYNALYNGLLPCTL